MNSTRSINYLTSPTANPTVLRNSGALDTRENLDAKRGNSAHELAVKAAEDALPALGLEPHSSAHRR